jgi:hypothetical protein
LTCTLTTVLLGGEDLGSFVLLFPLKSKSQIFLFGR